MYITLLYNPFCCIIMKISVFLMCANTAIHNYYKIQSVFLYAHRTSILGRFSWKPNARLTTVNMLSHETSVQTHPNKGL